MKRFSHIVVVKEEDKWDPDHLWYYVLECSEYSTGDWQIIVSVEVVLQTDIILADWYICDC